MFIFLGFINHVGNCSYVFYLFYVTQEWLLKNHYEPESCVGTGDTLGIQPSGFQV